MSTVDHMLEQARALPSEERARLALALLDTVETFDPHAELRDEELRAELRSRADDDEDVGESLEALRSDLLSTRRRPAASSSRKARKTFASRTRRTSTMTQSPLLRRSCSRSSPPRLD